MHGFYVLIRETKRLKSTGLESKRMRIQGPWQNEIAERWVGSPDAENRQMISVDNVSEGQASYGYDGLGQHVTKSNSGIGIRAPGQTFKSCMAQHANEYNLGGLVDTSYSSTPPVIVT
jgi:hypothetical protein